MSTAIQTAVVNLKEKVPEVVAPITSHTLEILAPHAGLEEHLQFNSVKMPGILAGFA
jgi:hypothetical protein